MRRCRVFPILGMLSATDYDPAASNDPLLLSPHRRFQRGLRLCRRRECHRCAGGLVLDGEQIAMRQHERQANRAFPQPQAGDEYRRLDPALDQRRGDAFIETTRTGVEGQGDRQATRRGVRQPIKGPAPSSRLGRGNFQIEANHPTIATRNASPSCSRWNGLDSTRA